MGLLTRTNFGLTASLTIAFVLLLALVPVTGVRAEVGMIYGSVFQSGTETPIDGAYVFLNGNESYVLTEKYGAYTLPGIEYGSYELWAYKEGYMPAHTKITVDSQAVFQDLFLDPEQNPKEGLIKGTVTLEAPTQENNVTSTKVTVKNLDLPGAEEVYVPVDGNWGTGYYAIALSPGTYSVVCGAPGHATETHSQVKVYSGKVTYEDFYLKAFGAPKPSIGGYVKDMDSGSPLQNATVIVHNVATGTDLFTNTDQNGFFLLKQVQEGDHTLAALMDGYEPGMAEANVVPGENMVDMDLRSSGEALLWGFVMGDGVLLDNGFVLTEDLLLVNSKLFGIPGLYALYPFPSGVAKEVTAWAPKHYPDSASVLVPAGTLKRQDFHLKYGQDEGASLVFARVLKEPDMVPLGGASISLDRIDPLTGASVFHRTVDLASDDNTWTVFPVPKGAEYSVKSTHAGFVMTRYKVGPSGDLKDDADTFEVTADSPVLLDLYMNGSILPPDGNCTIWGYVVLDLLGGFPVIGADVAITPYEGDLYHTGTSGRYEYHVSPGTYGLLALYPGGYNICPYDHDMGWWGIGEYPLTIHPGETRHIDFVMLVRSVSHSTIAGQVMDNTTLAPVEHFELMASSSSSSTSYTRTGALGYFMFSPITTTGGSWTLIGGYSLSDVVRVEYRTMPTGPWTTSNSWPVSFDVPASSLIYVNIYVDPVGPNDLNSSVIWGYVHRDTPSGELLEGALITLWPFDGDFIYSSMDGFYSYEVPFGDLMMEAVYPGMRYMLSLDMSTGTWGIGLWAGTLAPGESRHVDIMITFESGNASTISGRVLNAEDGTAVHGYRLKAHTDTYGLPVQTTVHGFFTFTPLPALSTPWYLIGDSAGYEFVRAESRVLPSGGVTEAGSYPVPNTLVAGTAVWVDIYVNMTISIVPGTLKVKVLEMFTYEPVKGIEVFAVSSLDPNTISQSGSTDGNGEASFELYPGEYTIQTSGPDLEWARPATTVSIRPDTRSDVTLYVPPADLVPGLMTKMKFVQGKGAVRDVRVQIAGVGAFTSDATGTVSFLLGYKGNYTVTFSQKIDRITKKDGTSVAINPDGTLPLVPGESYTVTLAPVRTITKSRGAELGDPLTVGLLVGALIALIVGFAAGYALNRNPKYIVGEE